MEIVFGITHFNRFELLELCLNFFDHLKFKNYGIVPKIVLYDDCSNELEYNKFIHKNNFRFDRIIRNDCNLGSTGNIYKMYNDFLKNEKADYFFNLDCDLIVSTSFPRVLRNFIDLEMPIISFYNSSSHGRNSIVKYKNEIVLKKDHIGSAGTLISRICLINIIKNVPVRESGFDWDWSKYLKENRVEILVTYRSYFLHIGFLGDNNSILNSKYGFDRAMNFYFNQRESKSDVYHSLLIYFSTQKVEIHSMITNRLWFLFKKYFIWTKL